MAILKGDNEPLHITRRKARRWDYVVKRGYLTPRQIAEATEFATAATRREKHE